MIPRPPSLYHLHHFSISSSYAVSHPLSYPSAIYDQRCTLTVITGQGAIKVVGAGKEGESLALLDGHHRTAGNGLMLSSGKNIRHKGRGTGKEGGQDESGLHLLCVEEGQKTWGTSRCLCKSLQTWSKGIGSVEV